MNQTLNNKTKHDLIAECERLQAELPRLREAVKLLIEVLENADHNKMFGNTFYRPCEALTKADELLKFTDKT